MEPKINLGDWAIDKVSGFAGTVTGIAYYIHASSRIELTPLHEVGATDNGPKWFDAARIQKSTTS